MSSPALPSNRDENWRYANLRPLAKARPEAVGAAAPPAALVLPPVLPGYERWVFIDGRFSAAHSSNAPDSCAGLLSFSAAGEALAAMLDSEIGNAGVDFALARLNGARGDEVLNITPADGADVRIELNFVGDFQAFVYRRAQAPRGDGELDHDRLAPPPVMLGERLEQ